MQSQDKSSQQQVSLQYDNIRLVDLFNIISRQTGYTFFYNNQSVNDQVKVNIHQDNITLEQVLERVLGTRGYGWELISGRIGVFKKEQAEKSEKKEHKDDLHTFSGIISMPDGTPLPGASISVVNGAAITRTNESGLFSFQVAAKDTVIRISYTGFKTEEVNVRTGAALHVTLQPLVTDLALVAVRSTGYQKIPRERATGSFAQVSNELLNRRTGPTILERLEGVANGVMFPNKDIPPYSNEAYVSVRGRSTILANAQPLIVVDNFPYVGDINLLNPNDVDNITILKDAAAASIWGAFSGNGVIVITTKKGKLRQPFKVQANMNLTVGAKPDLYYNKAFLPSPAFIDVEKYLFDKGFYDDDLTNNYSYPVVSPVVELLDKKRNGVISAADADAQINQLKQFDVRKDYEKYLYRNSVNQQYAVNMSAGGEHSGYMLSVGYDRNLSNKVGAATDRFTISNYSTFNFWDRAELSTGVSFVMNKYDVGYYDALIPNGGKSAYYPYARLADEQGKALDVQKDFRYSFISNLREEGLLDWTYRPLDEVRFADNIQRSYHIRLNPGLKVRIIKGLDAELRYQFEKQLSRKEEYYSIQTYATRNMINLFTQVVDGVVTHPVPVGGILQKNNGEVTGNNYRAQLNFNRDFGLRHSVSALAGLEQREIVTESSDQILYGYSKNTKTYSSALDYSRYYDAYMYLGPGGYIAPSGPLSRYNNEYISYYGNAAYTLNGKYILSGSARMDQSNIWGVNFNQKGVPLWSAGVSWDLSREQFYKWNLFPLLKLRATYGYNGNLDPTLFGKFVVSYLQNNTQVGLPAATIVSYPNPNLRWERSAMLNTGIDFEVRNGMLHGSIEYYRKKGTDLIGEQLMPLQSGVGIMKLNSADMKGGGVDVVLTTVNMNRQLGWVTDFLFSYNWDRITSYKFAVPLYTLPGTADGTGSRLFPNIGRPVYGVYSYRWAGLSAENGDPTGYLDGKISDEYDKILASNTDIIYNGPARPVIFGALRNTVSFKGITLSLNVTYKMGYYFRRSGISYSSLFYNWVGHQELFSRWQQPGDEKRTNVPSMIYPVNASRDRFYEYSEARVEKGDHIRLQDVRIAYSLNSARMKKAGTADIQLYLYANNLGLIWKANNAGLDPDFVVGYTAPRTVAIGCKVEF
ncbi:SusC/RagA family TonB-linked outer membrane protein [Chitinophaga agri]|uniref:SusC/RagA family TonB-linked outer membrane protein n=1 Tax=Chitinophaga agri TaxID=2703787 RepID=A0A6B9ZQA6_9BACT|nr:SusC/RagA family TonB-linked outer membrane protein [Chitinophaga agri]QHS63023.1 SusC/RagA family TonB-linked outer membrane protein [Chitinophaga agri]